MWKACSFLKAANNCMHELSQVDAPQHHEAEARTGSGAFRHGLQQLGGHLKA